MFVPEGKELRPTESAPKIELLVTGTREKLPLVTQLLLRHLPFRVQTFDSKFRTMFPRIQPQRLAGSGFFHVGNGRIQCIICAFSSSVYSGIREILAQHCLRQPYYPNAYEDSAG